MEVNALIYCKVFYVSKILFPLKSPFELFIMFSKFLNVFPENIGMFRLHKHKAKSFSILLVKFALRQLCRFWKQGAR
ncbi:hypothetical protein CSTERTH_08730 [Thermoclostridium stercorarium subsp. thermolacticum DSM 2910]|uniref:Uncharacterized protein n=1 Tax=Thermoclostridium stercorarium subsp. thermolacticum DSM 2910 TaxID=1121336 RepID=A0A1B1YEB6_THEST|nr:hypothetical protein CSTERTH_08730 [Thermoclostridium stercorarium subsp. thermolacticum DSM 2910]